MCYEQCHKLKTYMKSYNAYNMLKICFESKYFTMRWHIKTFFEVVVKPLDMGTVHSWSSALWADCCAPTSWWLQRCVCVCVCVSATSWRCQATKRVDIKPKVIFQANIAWFRAWPIDAYTQQVKLTCLKTPQKNTSFWLSLPILHGWVCKSRHHIHVQIHRDVKCQINKCHLYTNLKTHATF